MCCQRGSFSAVVLAVIALLVSSQGVFGEDAEVIADRLIAATRSQVERLDDESSPVDGEPDGLSPDSLIVRKDRITKGSSP